MGAYDIPSPIKNERDLSREILLSNGHRPLCVYLNSPFLGLSSRMGILKINK